MTKRTPQLETAILEGYAAGRLLVDVCHEHGISPSTFQNWKRTDEDFASRYAQAQLERAEALIDAAQCLAENPTSEWVRRRCSETGTEERLADHIRHARLRIDTNLRIARILFRQHDLHVARAEREEELALLDQEGAEVPVASQQAYVSPIEEAHARIRRGEPPLRPNPHRDADGNLLVPLKSQRGAWSGTPPAGG